MSKKSKKAQKKRAASQKRWAIVIGVVAVIVVIGVIATIALYQTREKDEAEDLTREEQLANVVADADQAIGEGDIDAGVSQIDGEINRVDDSSEKAALMATKAEIYFNSERYDEALEAALEAERTDSTSSINFLIAQIYEVKNDNAKAAEYYRAAAEKVDNSNPMSEQDRQYYESRANELGGAQ